MASTYDGQPSHDYINDIASRGVATKAINESVYSYLPGREDGPADAYRHLLLSAELTRRFGESYARALLWSHEVTGNIQDQTQEANKMDEHNNELGIKLGLKLRQKPGGGSWEDVVKGSRELVSNRSAKWLSEEHWRKNPKDDRTHRELKLGDPNINWPVDWNKAKPVPAPKISFAPELQPLHEKTRTLLAEFNQREGIHQSATEFDNTAAFITAAMQKAKMTDADVIGRMDGKLHVIHDTEELDVAIVDPKTAAQTPVVDSVAQSQQTAQRFENEEQQKQYAQSQSRGMSMA